MGASCSREANGSCSGPPRACSLCETRVLGDCSPTSQVTCGRCQPFPVPPMAGWRSAPIPTGRSSVGDCHRAHRLPRMIGRFDIYRGGRDLNASCPRAAERSPEWSGAISGHLRVVPAGLGAPESGPVRATCSTVASDNERGRRGRRGAPEGDERLDRLRRPIHPATSVARSTDVGRDGRLAAQNRPPTTSVPPPDAGAGATDSESEGRGGAEAAGSLSSAAFSEGLNGSVE